MPNTSCGIRFVKRLLVAEKRTLATQVLDAVAGATIRTVEKPWGEEVLIDAGEFIIKLITINHGHRTSLQYHEVKEEVIVVAQGSGGVVRAGASYLFNEIVRIRPGIVHRSFGDATLIEITTPENDDIKRLDDDYDR